MGCTYYSLFLGNSNLLPKNVLIKFSFNSLEKFLTDLGATHKLLNINNNMFFWHHRYPVWQITFQNVIQQYPLQVQLKWNKANNKDYFCSLENIM